MYIYPMTQKYQPFVFLPREEEMYKMYTHTNAYKNFIHNMQKMETSQFYVDRKTVIQCYITQQ